MSESSAFKNFKEKIRRGQDRIDRVENALMSGMFDVNYCIDGVEGWIEIKTPKEPKRSTTPLFGSNHKVSIDQANWALSQMNAGGICYVLIQSCKNLILIDGSLVDKINKSTIQELIAMSDFHCARPVKNKQHWEELRECLKWK